MKLIVCSKREIENNPLPNNPHAIISINQPNDCTKIPVNEYTNGVLVLHFDDAISEKNWEESEQGVLYKRECVMFNECHAREIFKFFNKVRALDTLIIHCNAGWSRSAGVASFLAQILQQDTNEFYKAPRFPNVHVRNIMRNVYYENVGVLIS